MQTEEVHQTVNTSSSSRAFTSVLKTCPTQHVSLQLTTGRDIPTFLTRPSVSVPSSMTKGVLPPPLRIAQKQSPRNKLPNRCWHFSTAKCTPSGRAPRLLPGCTGEIPKLLDFSILWAKKLPSRDFSKTFFPPARGNILPLLSSSTRSAHTPPPTPTPPPTTLSTQQHRDMPPAARARAARRPRSGDLVNACSQQQRSVSVYCTPPDSAAACSAPPPRRTHHPRHKQHWTWCRGSSFQGPIAATTMAHHYNVAALHKNGG